MYYFVFEQSINNQVSRLHDQIRDVVEDLKLSREIVKANPVQTMEDLTLDGIDKKYSTVVVVGSDSAINKMASVVVLQPKVVMGIVPTDSKSSFLELLGIKNWQEACRALARRKNITIDLGLINNKYFFLTQVFLLPGWTKESQRAKVTNFQIDFGSFSIEINTSKIVVANALLSAKNLQVIKKSLGDGKLDLIIPARSQTQAFWKNLFSSKPPEVDKATFSILHSSSFKISSKDAIPIIVANELIAKTPATFKIAESCLKIIVAKQV